MKTNTDLEKEEEDDVEEEPLNKTYVQKLTKEIDEIKSINNSAEKYIEDRSQEAYMHPETLRAISSQGSQRLAIESAALVSPRQYSHHSGPKTPLLVYESSANAVRED